MSPPSACRHQQLAYEQRSRRLDTLHDCLLHAVLEHAKSGSKLHQVPWQTSPPPTQMHTNVGSSPQELQPVFCLPLQARNGKEDQLGQLAWLRITPAVASSCSLGAFAQMPSSELPVPHSHMYCWTSAPMCLHNGSIASKSLPPLCHNAVAC